MSFTATHMDFQGLNIPVHQQDREPSSKPQWDRRIPLEKTVQHSQVSSRCGLFQSGALFIILLRIGLNFLSHIVTKSGYGYLFQNEPTTISSFYIQMIFSFMPKMSDMDSLIHLTRIYCNKIGLLFRMVDCYPREERWSQLKWLNY